LTNQLINVQYRININKKYSLRFQWQAGPCRRATTHRGTGRIFQILPVLLQSLKTNRHDYIKDKPSLKIIHPFAQGNIN